MIQPAKLIDYFPDVGADQGLSYIEPAALAVTSVMTHLKAVLLEFDILAGFEQKSLSTSSDASNRPPAICGFDKQPNSKGNKKSQAIHEPVRAPSIRNLGKPAILMSSTIIPTAMKLPSEGHHNSKKRGCAIVISSPATSSRKKALPVPNNNLHLDDQYTEEILMSKTKDQLLSLCSSLKISIPRSSNKNALVEAIMCNRGDGSKKLNMHPIAVSEDTRTRIVREGANNNIVQNHIVDNIGKVMNGIENRITNHLAACVSGCNQSKSSTSSTMLNEELVATKATLAAERQQKKEHKQEATQQLNEHVEIFGKISEAATKPLMEVMRLFSQSKNNSMASESTGTSIAGNNSIVNSHQQPSTPMCQHNNFHQHQIVLPSSSYIGAVPSTEQLLLNAILNQHSVIIR